MSGSATFTTVMSSSSMKMATQTAPSVHHFVSDSIVELFNQERRPGRPAEVAQGGQDDVRRSIVVEQMRLHLALEALARLLAELRPDAAAEDDRLDVEQVDRTRHARAERLVGAVEDVGGEL